MDELLSAQEPAFGSARAAEVGCVVVEEDAGGQRAAAADAGFGEDRLEVVLHGVGREVQLGADVGGADALQDELDHVLFPVGEPERGDDERHDLGGGPAGSRVMTTSPVPGRLPGRGAAWATIHWPGPGLPRTELASIAAGRAVRLPTRL